MKDKKVLDILAGMSLKEKVYQTVISQSGADFYTSEQEDFEKYVREKPYGAFFVGEEIIGGNKMDAHKIREAIARYNKLAKFPTAFCADTEFGCGYLYEDGSVPSFPWQMTLGATADESLAYEYGKLTALQAREVGINLSLSPVADINVNWLNPVVNTRAIGDNADLVKRMLAAMVDGMQEYGLGATAKHFPGDGTDYRDQHYVMTKNWLSKEDWDKSFGAVYRKLIEHGVSSVMVGHLSFPAYQKERKDGFALPATLSREVITDLLKGELGFDGVVMTDALCMNGFRTAYDTQIEAEIAAFKAGADMLLWPSDKYPATLEQKLASGEIPMERLDDAVYRIVQMKLRQGIWEKKPLPEGSLTDADDFDRKVSEAGVTCVRDRKNEFPLRDVKKAIIIGITKYQDEMDHLSVMKDEFERHGIEVKTYHNKCTDEQWPETDLIVYATFCHQHKPCGFLDIQPSWQTASYKRECVVVCSFGSPYLINQYFPTVNKALALYSDTDGCMRAAVRAMLGKIKFSGTLPVTLQEY